MLWKVKLINTLILKWAARLMDLNGCQSDSDFSVVVGIQIRLKVQGQREKEIHNAGCKLCSHAKLRTLRSAPETLAPYDLKPEQSSFAVGADSKCFNEIYPRLPLI